MVQDKIIKKTRCYETVKIVNLRGDNIEKKKDEF